MEENWGNESAEQVTQYDGGTSYGNAPYGNAPYSNVSGVYGQPMNDLEEPMTMGDWFLTLIVQIIPCVNLICLIYWAFSSNVQKTKQNYCRVVLIFYVILAVLYLIIGAAIGSMIASMASPMYY